MAWCSGAVGWAVLFGGVVETPVRAAEGADFAAAAKKNFRDTQAQYKKLPENSQAAWQFARACFDVADYSTNSAERAKIAEQGIAACRRLMARESNSAPAHYYLGMNLAQLAQTKGLAALKIVDEMEREFSLARALDEHFDFAGPDRNLGLLYRDTPSFGSIGSRTKARRHLLRAAEVAPDYPENRLNLIESYMKWGDSNGAQRELKALDELWPRARMALAGAGWASSWADWEQRLKKIKKKVGEPSRTIEAPRQKQ